MFQVAKNHSEAFTSSNVYSLIHHQQKALALAPTLVQLPLKLMAVFPLYSLALDQAPKGTWLCFIQVEGLAEKCLAFTNLVRGEPGFICSLATLVFNILQLEEEDKMQCVSHCGWCQQNMQGQRALRCAERVQGLWVVLWVRGQWALLFVSVRFLISWRIALLVTVWDSSVLWDDVQIGLVSDRMKEVQKMEGSGIYSWARWRIFPTKTAGRRIWLFFPFSMIF